MAVKVPSPKTRLALRSLGANLKVARLKRRMSMRDFAERIGVSERTVARLEKSDAGVSIGALALTAKVLGELDRISNFLGAGSDDIGLLLEQERLPKPTGRKRSAGRSPTVTGRDLAQSGNEDDEGVGF